MVEFLGLKNVYLKISPGAAMKFTIVLTSLITLFFSITGYSGTLIRLNSGTISTSGFGEMTIPATGTIVSEWIIQFKSHITETNKKSLNGIGIKILAYMPEDALIVRSTSSQLQSLNKSEIQAVLPLAASMKISPEIQNSMNSNSATTQTFIISAYDVKDVPLLLKELRKKNVLVNTAAGTSVIATAALSELAAVASLIGVEHIQFFEKVESLYFKPSAEDLNLVTAAGDYSDINGTETGTFAMNFESAWQQNYLGQNQIVGMADTGLDSGDARGIHSDFTGAVKAGYAVGLFGKTWADPMGHGTHVAGSVLGRGTVSGGKIKGGAYAAQIVAQGMWSPILNNLSVPNDLGKMFAQAYDDGARMHTNSWGSAASFGTYEKMAATVDQVMFEKQDLLIIFAAGNSGVDKDKDGRIDPNSIGTPGTAKNALTVGASENFTTTGGIQKKVGELNSAKDNWPVPPITLSTMSDNINGLAMFSSRGPTSDGRIKPDIVAPGTNILSVKSQQPTAEKLWGEYNSNYVWSGGTSMATPLTAGAAAVARQILIDKVNPKPTAAFLKAYLMQTATEMFPGQYGQAGASQGQEILTLRPNNDEGYGRVNLAQIAKTDSIVFSVDDRSGVATAEVFSKKITLPRSGHLVVNLVWTDAPGSTNSAKALVNDLDLKVALSDGKTLEANDQINNHSFVQSDVTAGTEATVTVSGINVPMGISGKQPFALIVSIQ